MFSRRSGWPRASNAFAAQLERARSSGRELLDLSLSSPTEVGLEYPWKRIAAALSDPRGARYAPEPLGLLSAREAVAEHYATRGVRVEPSQVVLTASTSEAYGFLFKLLADPGDAVLVPLPGYPLLDMLADLVPLKLRAYPLAYDDAWSIDLANMAEVAKGARAMLVVAPHNPTGHAVDARERQVLGALARAHDLALVVDEVFADYAPGHRSFAGFEGALTFTLSGLSKVAAMPQLKLGWMVVSGPAELRDEALARLELIADAFLSVATPVQVGLGELLACGAELRAQLVERIAVNRATLRRARADHAPWDILRGENGWYALLHVPRTRTQDEWCQALLEGGLIVLPGHLFDLEAPHALVVSLLVEPESFERGARILAETIV